MNRAEEHRDEEQLLRLLDGELDTKEAAQAEAHLQACWRCRTRLEGLQNSISAYMRYHETALKPLSPAPPQPWGRLESRLAQVDADLTSRRSVRPLGASSMWLAAAAAAAVIAVAGYRISREPVVSAAELLQKASAAETGPTARGRIQIKTRARTFPRARSAHAVSAAFARQESDGQLAALFAAAHFSWEEPLSARSFAAWRGQLHERVDHVILRSDPARGERVYELRTTTSAGNLTDARLTIRAADFQAVHETLQFSAGEQVEISELPDDPAEALPAPSSPVASAPEAPRFKQEPIGERTATAGDELHVIAALHRIGADLGEPIEVTRTGAQVLVTGTGLEHAREEQIRELLTPLPGVVLRFEQPQSPIPEKQATPRIDSRQPTAPVSALQLRLQAYLASPADLRKLTDEILDASEGTMGRAHALRNLAARFPVSAETTLTPEEMDLLASLRRDHAGALKDLAQRIARLLQPVLNTPEQSGLSAPRAASWQDRAQDLLDAGRQVDRLLNEMLAGVSSGNARSPAPDELASALASLRARLAADEMQ